MDAVELRHGREQNLLGLEGSGGIPCEVLELGQSVSRVLLGRSSSRMSHGKATAGVVCASGASTVESFRALLSCTGLQTFTCQLSIS